MSLKRSHIFAFIMGDLFGTAVIALIGAFLFSSPSTHQPAPKPTVTHTVTASPTASPSPTRPSTAPTPTPSATRPESTPTPSFSDTAAKAPRRVPQAIITSRAPVHVSRSTPRPAAAAGSPRAYARSVMSAGQYACFDAIATRESGWNVYARNRYSGAYGIGQALPGSKMASAGADWRTNGITQVKWMRGYIKARYGTPCGAWSFWKAHHWY